MVKTKETTTVRITKTHEHEISGECLRHMLSGLLGKPVPSDAEITVRVPGGGDYSHSDLDINEHPITVTWTTTELP
jgi:hypothetical protein